MKFSVIIPVYNKANTIKTSIDSVLAQTVKDFEIVVVDDGSTDNIKEVLSSYSGLQVFHKENGGVSVARNMGIEKARGEYICFLDADDEWKENHLETLLFLIEKYPNTGYYFTSHITITVDGEKHFSSDALYKYNDDFECDNLLNLLNNTSYGIIHTNSICVKKSILVDDNIYFEPNIKIGEDTDVWYRLALKHSVAISKKETTVYLRENSTATKNSFHTHNWIFYLRADEIMRDEDINENIKESVEELLDRYKMTSCREYMLQENRKQAQAIIKSVKNKEGKRYWLSKAFCYLPYSLCKTIYKKVM